MSRRIGILGGMFDPIHRGHLDLAQAASATLELTGMFVVPANIPPHRPAPVASSFHRFAMVSLAVAGRASWRASDIELCSEAPSYTAATLKAFHEQGYDGSELFFLTGADAFLEIETWNDYPALLDSAHFAVVSRPGISVLDLPERMPTLAHRMVRPPLTTVLPVAPSIFLVDRVTTDVSSTAVRARCLRQESIAGLVDPAVQQHIEQHDLYGPAVAGHSRIDPPPHAAASRLHAHSRQRRS